MTNRTSNVLMTLASLLMLFSAPSLAAQHSAVEDALKERLPELMEKAEIPGLQVALIENGVISWTGSFGVADVDSGVSVTDKTLFEGASLSKPVFAYLVMQLAEAGEIDLDVPLQTLLENERLRHDPRSREITPRMVLTHTSGLPNWGGTPLEFRFDPGRAFGYSGEGYVYLQQAVEKITGKSLQELADEFVFDPAEMTQSYFWRSEDAAGRARGHNQVGAAERAATSGTANAAASLITTATDYGRFVTALLKNKPASGASNMLEPAVVAGAPFDPGQPGEAPMSWALGLGVDGVDEYRIFWHWGDNGVFRAFVAFSPAKDRGVVFFANSQNGLSIVDDITTIVFSSKGNITRWLGAEQWNSPARVARRTLLNTFREKGGEALMSRLEAMDFSGIEDRNEHVLGPLAQMLEQINASGAAVKVLRWAEKFAPEDSDVKQALAQALATTGDVPAAIAVLREALSLAPKDDADLIRFQIDWLGEYLKGDRPSQVDTTPLIGQYGPRKVWVEGSRLMYQRGEGAALELRPFSDTLFEVGDLTFFRLEFNLDENGVASSVTGRYIDGRTDESVRR